MARYRDPFTGHYTTKAKYARAVDRLYKQFAEAINRDDDRKATKLRAKLDKYPPLARKTRKPKAEPRRESPRPAPAPKRRIPKAQEWEFGKDYKSPRRGGHNVSVNVRLVFDEPVSEKVARQAMKEYIDGGEPEGVQIEGVDWRTARGRERQGTAGDFDNFRSIMYAEGIDYLRAGAVKLDLL